MARGPLAGAAGPGKFSKRTDMNLPSQSYGEGVDTQAIKSGAPLAKTPDVKGTPASQIRRQATGGPVVPLYAPTQRPEEPVTAGSSMGAGPGPEVLGINQAAATEDDLNFRASINEYLPVLSYIASLPSTSPETRRAIRQLRDNL